MTTLEGKIKKIFDKEVYGTFEKRVFWLEDISEKYPNIWQLEIWNKDIPMMDNYNVGDFITAYVDIKGKLTRDAEKVITSLKCWNIKKDGVAYKAVP